MNLKGCCNFSQNQRFLNTPWKSPGCIWQEKDEKNFQNNFPIMRIKEKIKKTNLKKPAPL